VKKAGQDLDLKVLLFFFIPLGLSASLVTLSHLIINSTLVRAENSEFVIATYAIALSLLGITERLGVILRQTCSSLVKDKASFRLMASFTVSVVLSLMAVSISIAFTPIGDFIFAKIFGAKANMVEAIKGIYQILIFVTIFSAVRCLNQGVIIYQRQTKWLTIGMAIRLAAMYLISLYFIQTGNITGKSGAIIFLFGMVIESLISTWEARGLIRKMPETHPQKIASKKQIYKFYSPLMLSSVIIVMVGPAINVFLGKTSEIELAIASYALALSITQLFLSFFSYVHQIVINFYSDHKVEVKRFVFIIGFIPCLLLGIFCYTSIGTFFLEHMMGVHGRLLDATIQVLRVFMLMALFFPFVDFFNGLLMVHKQTKVTVISQTTNFIVTLSVLFIGIRFAAHWNGIIGALGQSVGLFAELIVLSSIIKTMERKKGNITSFQLKSVRNNGQSRCEQQQGREIP
jgi:progressive ankylosis protein